MWRCPGTGQALCRFLRERSRMTGDERGQAAILTAGILVFLTMIGLVAANVGILVATRTSVQRAADAAVLAGCADLPNVAVAKTRAEDYGQTKNAGPSSSHLESGNTVTVTYPAPDPVLGQRDIRVSVQRQAPMIGPFTLSDSNVGAAGTCRRDEGRLAAMLALGQGSERLVIESGATVQMGHTGLVSASTSGSGLTVRSGASVTGRYLDTATGAAAVLGTVKPRVQQVPSSTLLQDPYAGVAQPQLGGSVDLAPGTLTVPPNSALADIRPGCEGKFQIPPPAPDETSPARPRHCHIWENLTAPLEPGIYWGGLELGNPNPNSPVVTVELKPGIYFLAGGGSAQFEGGGLRVWPNTIVTGTGVMFFNGRDPFATNLFERGCGRVQIHPGAQFNVTPPQTGIYSGLLFFQDRNQQGDCGSGVSMSITEATLGVPIPLSDQGNACAVAAPGAEIRQRRHIYVPGSSVNIEDSTMYVDVIANRITVTGQVTFKTGICSGTLFHGQIHLIE
jgi:Flp pilus assembly protein TadG